MEPVRSIAFYVALSVALFTGLLVVMFFSTVAFFSRETERTHRRTRARNLAMYRHLPDANLLKLND